MRVLFTSSPGWGHIHPMVPLAAAFSARGDDVLWATAADACRRLEPVGVATAAAGLGEREGMAAFGERFPETQRLEPSDRPDFMFPRLFGTIRAASMFADLAPLAEDWAPDLVVCDAAEFAGPIVAARAGVPAVSHAFGALLPEHRVAAAGDLVASIWEGAGLRPRPHGGMYDHLYLDIYPPSLQAPERPHVAATQPLRPEPFATAGDEELPHWVTAPSATPLVYVTFGTVFRNDEALSAVVQGVRDLPLRVAVTVGPHGDPTSLGRQPDHVHIANYIPQDRLLPHCAAVISHGGSGTFLAAIAAEVPQLCLPQAADQFMNAAACVRSGAGLALQPAEVTPESVREATTRLLSDPAFAVATRRVGAEMATMPSPGEVADQLRRRFG